MQLEMFVDLTHDDGKPISLVVDHIYAVRPKTGGGSFVISNGGTPVPVREDHDKAKRVIETAKASRKETSHE